MLLRYIIIIFIFSWLPHLSFANQLMKAVENNSYNQANTLLSSGVDPDKSDISKVTPLMRASLLNNLEMLKLLLQYNANPNNKDIANTTAGVAGLTPDTMGMPVSRMKKKKKRREIEPMLTTESRKRVEKAIKAMNSSDSKEFKSEIDGMPVFRVSEAEFARCKGKKAKGQR